MLKVINYFSSLLRMIQPLQTEVVKANGHSGPIRARIGTSFKLVSFLPMGSHKRGTAIRSFSDVDYFAVVSRNDARWGDGYINSQTFLVKLRENLRGRFPSTNVSRSGQSVIVHFEQGNFAVDVVPSIFWEMRHSGIPIYLIPDGNGDYIEACPYLQNRYIMSKNLLTGGKLKNIIQLFKFWKHNRSVDILLCSFHLEILLACNELCVGSKSIV